MLGYRAFLSVQRRTGTERNLLSFHHSLTTLQQQDETKAAQGGGRFLRLKAVLALLGIRRFYTDSWGAYRWHLDPHQHIIGKRRTQQLERNPLPLRTRITRLVRKAMDFSQSVAMHGIVIRLFINRFTLGLPMSIDHSPSFAT